VVTVASALMIRCRHGSVSFVNCTGELVCKNPGHPRGAIIRTRMLTPMGEIRWQLRRRAPQAFHALALLLGLPLPWRMLYPAHLRDSPFFFLTNAIYPGVSMAQASEAPSTEAGNDGENTTVSADDKGKAAPGKSEGAGRTDHGADRAEEAKTDSHRQVGDKNKVIENGRQYTDNDTGNTAYVDGDRVVVTNSKGEQVTQFRNTRANTNARVESGRWTPVDKK